MTGAGFFSVASFYHRHYLVTLTPAIAALVGAGAVTLWRDYRRPGWRGWLLPVALVGTAVVQAHILADYPAWRDQLQPIVIGLGLVAALGLTAARLRRQLSLRFRMPAAPAATALAGVLALLVAPTVWAADTTWNGTSATLPVTGPTPPRGGAFARRGGDFPSGGRGGGDMGIPRRGFDGGGAADQRLIAFLEANRGGSRFLVATTNSQSATPLILATGQPVMALGGFAGSDPILTADDLAKLVANGTVRYFLVPSTAAGAGGFGGFASPSSGRTASGGGLPGGRSTDTRREGEFAGGFGMGSSAPWVNEHCTAVPADQWQATSSTSGRSFGRAESLFDCGGAGAH